MKNQTLDQAKTNREVAETIGDLTEALYTEVMPLPMSDKAKHLSVMAMVSNMMTRSGDTIIFRFPH